MALLNVSAMSFGALSKAALVALNQGAHAGGFAHDTGEGGLTEYHLKGGGDLIWELGSGYFGARTKDGGFDADEFKDKAAHAHVKLVSLKLSQGAKPGIGGQLPGSKVTKEIAQARDVPQGETCVSPAAHKAFHTPRELVRFIARMRELAGGKPAGFKLCVGSRRELLAICKAMVEEGTAPDFIIVDGAEGGTGAAPMEYADHVGTPLTEGLMTVHNALVGAGLRDRIKRRRQRQGRDRLGHRQAARAGRRLHQRRAGDDDGGRLHPVAGVPSQHVPGRRRDAGPEARARARRRRTRPNASPATSRRRSRRRCGSWHRWGSTIRAKLGPRHLMRRVDEHTTAVLRRALRVARAGRADQRRRARELGRRLATRERGHVRMTTVAEHIVAALARQGVTHRLGRRRRRAEPRHRRDPPPRRDRVDRRAPRGGGRVRGRPRRRS